MLPHKSSNKLLNLLLAMYFNGTVHTSKLLLNLCPRMLLEPFTLDTLLSNKLGRIFDTVSFLMTSLLLLGCRLSLQPNSSSGEYDVIRNSIF